MVNKINLRDFPRGENGQLQVEEGTGYASLRDSNGGVTLRRIPRFGKDIRETIWQYIAENPEGVTMGEIAKAVDRKKTPWLDQKVQGMIRDGYLFRIEESYRPNMPVYLYFIKD